eukprot:1138434-Pelagomonas_calceolata.AAC.4
MVLLPGTVGAALSQQTRQMNWFACLLEACCADNARHGGLCAIMHQGDEQLGLCPHARVMCRVGQFHTFAALFSFFGRDDVEHRWRVAT